MTLATSPISETQSELAQTVCAAQQGDRQAFGRLMARYERSVYSVLVRRLRNHAEVQELSQEVFIQAMRKIDQLRDPRCFGGWLRSIAARMAINRAMRRRPQVTGDAVVEAACVEHETPLSAALRQEQATQVRSGLRRLGKLDRATLEAFYFRGQSLVEMSEHFRSPVGTIKRRLHVARKRLAQELKVLEPA